MLPVSSWTAVFVFAVLGVWLAIVSVWLWKVASHYWRLTKGTDKEDLRSILEELKTRAQRADQNSQNLGQELKKLASHSLRHIQKLGVVRFNPFGDTGGNQSAAVALLDGQDCGVVILSLHGREGTRVYVKAVKNGKADGLSKEEIAAIQQAKK